MRIKVTDLVGEASQFANVDRLHFLNQESYGGMDRMIPDAQAETILAVNVNAVTTVLIEL